jgi:hypothetical protein
MSYGLWERFAERLQLSRPGLCPSTYPPYPLDIRYDIYNRVQYVNKRVPRRYGYLGFSDSCP